MSALPRIGREPPLHGPECQCRPCLVEDVAARVRRLLRDELERLLTPRPGRLLSKREAAERLGVSQSMVERLAANGDIEARKVGSSWRCTEASVERYIAEGPDDA